jgi:hypothetical protein
MESFALSKTAEEQVTGRPLAHDRAVTFQLSEPEALSAPPYRAPRRAGLHPRHPAAHELERWEAQVNRAGVKGVKGLGYPAFLEAEVGLEDRREAVEFAQECRWRGRRGRRPVRIQQLADLPEDRCSPSRDTRTS